MKKIEVDQKKNNGQRQPVGHEPREPEGQQRAGDHRLRRIGGDGEPPHPQPHDERRVQDRAARRQKADRHEPEVEGLALAEDVGVDLLDRGQKREHLAEAQLRTAM